MLTRLKFLLFSTLFVVSGMAARAQDNDYLKHGKIFCLCSYKIECSYCYNCNDERYTVKISNNVDKKIKEVYYKFYSDTYNKFFEKEAKIQLGQIDALQAGIIHICVPDANQWIISKIVYEDGSANTFTLKGRMMNFHQSIDECDCNDE